MTGLMMRRDAALALESTRAGHVLLVHPAGRLDRQAMRFASGLAHDPEHQLVIVDLPAGSELATWESVASLLESSEGGIRLVSGRPPKDGIRVVGSWLAERLGRTVLIADGPTVPAAGGALFIPNIDGQGWVWCAPGRPTERHAQRFPQPRWEHLIRDKVRAVGSGTVVEPLPAGEWLRGGVPMSTIAASRQRLVGDLVCQVDRLTVVLGTPGGPPVPLDDIVVYWRSMLLPARAAALFVPYGPVELAGHSSLGQALADLLDQPVALHPGLPAVDAGAGDGDAVPPGPRDASLGPLPSAREVTYVPGSKPMDETPAQPSTEQATVPPDVVAPDAVGPEVVGAEGLAAAPALPDVAAPADPVVAGTPVVRVQPVPAAAASAVLPPWGIDEERAWLRRTYSREHDAEASSVARILSQSPGLRGDRATLSDVVTDLAAVRLYLAGASSPVDGALRSAVPGDHVPMARCIASGLQRLPSYRGVAALRATLTDAEWAWYEEEHQVVAEWGFLAAHTGEPREPAGNVDFLIWSISARRTAPLDPAVPDRVLFLPGTRFKVLSVRTGTARRAVLLREFAASEVGPDGQVDAKPVRLDGVALAGLERAAGAWVGSAPAVGPSVNEATVNQAPGLALA